MTLHTGDSAEVLKQYPDNHFDSVVTDPPYGIEFLAKEWDKNTGPIEVWRECLRVLKPGGHLLAFSAARKYHRLATNLEDIGFEIRDQIMWIYGSGFPKGQDMGKLIDKREKKYISNLEDAKYNPTRDGVVFDLPGRSGSICKVCNKDSANRYHCGKGDECGTVYKPESTKAKEWAGWKTGLKPAHEPIVMARKPFKGSTIDNVLKHGTGAINIDDTRVGIDILHTAEHSFGTDLFIQNNTNKKSEKTYTGRYPSNVIMSEEEGKVLDSKTSKGSVKKAKPSLREQDMNRKDTTVSFQNGLDKNIAISYNDGGAQAGGASKYYYCPKVSRKERNVGCDMHEPITGKDVGPWSETGERLAVKLDKMTTKHNNHPTVKPVALMKYLVTLITPKGGKVLDPFNGSGSTGMAVKEFGGEYTGIDLNANYIEIANKRIAAW